MKDFEKIKGQETNENTALILMMSILGDKLSRIIKLLENNNRLLEKSLIHKDIAEYSKEQPRVKVYYMPLTPEDYD